MTRAEFVAELSSLWEESAQIMEIEGYANAAKEMKVALDVLKRTYSVGELKV